MNLWITVDIGLKEIWAHKFRSLLTMLGIILGVSSLVAMSAMVKGMENGLKEALVEAGGLEKIVIQYDDELPTYQRHLRDRSAGLTLNDVYALKSSAPLISKVTPTVELRSSKDVRNLVAYKTKRSRPWRIYGTWPSILEIEEHEVEHGRMFNEIDDEQARSVCVIGVEIRNELFGDPDKTGEEIIPIGKVININGQPFTIIGMFKHYMSATERKARELAKLESQQQSGPVRSKGRRRSDSYVFRMKNDSLMIPLNTMLLKFRSAAGTNSAPDRRLSGLQMKIPSVDLLEPSLQQVRNVMMTTHNGMEDWTFRTEEDQADEIATDIRNYRMSGGIIAAISLIVGGIGIMNIMMASISERVREIGIRKSVGATTGSIFVQIIIESIVVALLGGLAGLLVSVGLVEIITSFTPSDNDPQITAGALGFAFACSAAVGVIAGLVPAFKAARLHPIQALKYE